MHAVQTEILSFIFVSKLGIANNFYSRKIKIQYYQSNLMPWTKQLHMNFTFLSVSYHCKWPWTGYNLVTKDDVCVKSLPAEREKLLQAQTLESHLRITCPLAERVLKVLQPISQQSSWSLSWQNLPLLPFQSMRWPLISSFPDQSCPYWLAYRHKRQWQRRLHFNEVFDLHLQSFP